MVVSVDDHQRRIARARLLRRQGMTYAEIRAVIGDVSDDRLEQWLRGIPRPPETRRTHRLSELRSECRRLRGAGWTYAEIAARTGAPKGSISAWVRDIRPPARKRCEERRLAGLRASAATRRRLGDRQREVQAAVASAGIGPLTERELFLVGLGLYWAEGSKSKPYDRRERVVFVNSDRSMITTFLAWLTLLGIPRTQCRFRVAIHESADVGAAEQTWATIVGIDRTELRRTTIKRHRPKTNRLNTGDGYVGCLVIDVTQSAELYRFISGWWTGLARQAATDHRRAVEWPASPPWRTWRRFDR